MKQKIFTAVKVKKKNGKNSLWNLLTCKIVSKLKVSPFHKVNSPLDAPVTNLRPSGVHYRHSKVTEKVAKTLTKLTKMQNMLLFYVSLISVI